MFVQHSLPVAIYARRLTLKAVALFLSHPNHSSLRKELLLGKTKNAKNKKEKKEDERKNKTTGPVSRRRKT